MGRVAGYYYNTHARVAFKDQLTNQVLEDETSLLNQMIQNYDQISPSTPKYHTSRENQSASVPRMNKSHLKIR